MLYYNRSDALKQCLFALSDRIVYILHMNKRGSRIKGSRIEREIVQKHKDIGIFAERVPLSGAAGGSYSGDVVIDRDLRAEVKARSGGAGFQTLERWMGDNDLLFLRRDRAEPMVAMPWATYEKLISAQCAQQTTSD
jgi:Holliday junction resolvase